MPNLNLVEEYPKDAQLTQFEKVLIAAKRAKDLHKGTKVPLLETEHKDTYVALEEIRADKIHSSYREDEAAELPAPAAEEEEED
jgi:DNA-directed RNA polymerase omega subunit